MNKEQIQSFLGKTIVINFILIAVMAFILSGARDWIIGIWQGFIPISYEEATTFIFYFLGYWKLLLWVLFVIPYIALRMTKN